MGMIVEGKWVSDDKIIQNSAYIREMSKFTDPIELEANTTIGSEPRYWLIASKSCPWSHGATIVRSLHKLEGQVGLHTAHGPRIEGYAIDGGESWNVPGTSERIEHLHQLYTLANKTFTGRSTIPVLWDAKALTILSNDSRSIMRSLSEMGKASGDGSYNLAPIEIRSDIDAMIDWLFADLSNAVYRAGFAESQLAYDEAETTVFATLDALENRLSDQRYLLGAQITEADWRLFATLVRFDSVYVILHRCCRKRLTDYPALWSYARELYALPGVAETVDFPEILRGSYLNDTSNNPHNIIPVLPDVDWNAPHDRHQIGAAKQSNEPAHATIQEQAAP
ncbi:glutathione S-transferase C-terminal domain-containing protein [Aliiroseovarius sp. 2305UL8-7]|uniref:glutathione S-transferase C-terminal domain-containing protein n=1 Tax=Aliiroseovarius conchicola TaxID=3121637 RepID=UPI003526E25C